MDGKINMNSICENLLAMDTFEESGQGQIIENLETIIFEKKIKVDCKYIYHILNLDSLKL